ncbi:MAG: hypothetical protein AAGI17_07710 [Planctomycetota bacterium]
MKLMIVSIATMTATARAVVTSARRQVGLRFFFGVDSCASVM